jgi:hypothetical protein
MDTKKITFIAFFIFLGTTFLQAQDYYSSRYLDRPISMGISLSPNLSWLQYGDEEEYSSSAKLGFSYGLTADFAFSPNYYFATGLLVNTLSSGVTTPAHTGTYRIQYVEIPLALKLRSTQRYFRNYYGQFGFTGGINVNGKQKVSPDYKRKDLQDDQLMRLALQIGGGVEWQLDHNLIFVTGITYNNGFTKVLKPGSPQSSYVALNFGVSF